MARCVGPFFAWAHFPVLYALLMGVSLLCVQHAYADADLYGRPAETGRLGAWQQRTFKYVAIDQDIRGLMAEFGRVVGVRTEISTHVRARIQKRRYNQSATAFLNDLSREHGLQWYYDGSALFITSTGEAVTRLIPLGSVSATRLQEELRMLGLFDTRYTFRFSPSSRMILVSGPPRFVATIEAALATLADQRNRQVFTVIRGGQVSHDTVLPMQK